MSERARPARRLVQVCAFGAAALIAWAALAPLDIVSTAPGEIVPFSQMKKVQHLEGGVIAEILVREGDRVAPEQALVVLEGAAPSADSSELRTHIAGLRIEAARLEAEAEGRERLDFPEDLARGYPQNAAQARTLFASRRQSLAATSQAQREVVAQREQTVRELSARILNTRNALKLQAERVHISEALLKEEITSRLQHLDMLREQNGLKSRVEEDTAALARTQASIAEARAQLAALINAYRQEVATQLAATRRDLAEKTQRMAKYADSLRRITLRAPAAGTVKTLSVSNRGGVVQPGQVVVEIVPEGDELLAEVRLPVRDIGYVRPGQPAFLRLASAEAARFGNLAGRVVHVSPDSSAGTAGEGAHYRVRIQTAADRFGNGGLEYRLIPGVAVQSSILIGRRSVLDYLLAPFLAGAGTALREP